MNSPQVFPDLTDHLPTLRTSVALLKVNPLVVKLQVALLIEGFPTPFTGEFVVIFVNLRDVDIYVLEPTRADGAFLLELQMSGVVVDLLHLTVPQHPPTADHPAGHAPLLLPPAVLVGQVSLHIPELSGTNVADFLLSFQMDHIDVILQSRLSVVDLVAKLARDLGVLMADLHMFLYFLESLSTYRTDFLLDMNILDMSLHILLSTEGAVTTFHCALDSAGVGSFMFCLGGFQDGDNHGVPLLAFLFQRFSRVGI